MSLKRHLLGHRSFWTEDRIRSLVNAEVEKSFLIFQTSKQQTWLLKTADSLTCILDDARKPEPQVQWSLDLSEVDSVRARPISGKSGLVDIGSRKNWYYSNNLFREPADIEAAIKSVLPGS